MTEDERTELAIERHTALALRRFKDGLGAAGESLPECEACGNVIPQARRQAVPGVRLCVGCKQAEEQEAKQWAR